MELPDKQLGRKEGLVDSRAWSSSSDKQSNETWTCNQSNKSRFVIRHNSLDVSTDQQSTITSTRGVTIRNRLKQFTSNVIERNSIGLLRENYMFDNVMRTFDQGISGHRHSPHDQAMLIRVNVSGLLFEACSGTFESRPETLLGNAEKRMPFAVAAATNEFFFDRCRRSFVEIFNFYQTGELRRPDKVSLANFAEELRFFQIDGQTIRQLFIDEKATQFLKSHHNSDDKSLRRKIYNLINVPFSSKWAIAIFALRILLHLFMLSIFLSTPNILKFSVAFLYCSEIICYTIICVDVCLNLYAAPNRRGYLCSFFTIIDIFSVIFYILLLVLSIGFHLIDNSQRNTLNAAIKILQLFRILQIFRHSRSIITDALGRALQNSSMQILSIFFVIGILSFFFGALFYFSENATPLLDPIEGNDTFPIQMVGSMWDGIWLALITMTTVGYGDLYPQTYVGRAVAVVCTCLGQAIISMIIPIMSNLYQQYYEGREQEDTVIGSLRLCQQIADETVAAEEDREDPEDEEEVISRTDGDINESLAAT